MGKLFVGNFDFEYRLAGQYTRQLPKKLEQINLKLLDSWLPVMSSGDAVWWPAGGDLSDPAAVRLRQSCQQRGLLPVTDVSELDASVIIELVCWGWTESLLNWGRQQKWQVPAMPAAAVVWANSRATSAGLESAWGCAIPGSGTARNFAELSELLEQGSETGRWVIKAEFGMSARERLLGQGGDLSLPARNWLHKQFARERPVFFEPWVERVAECSFHYQIDAAHEVRAIGQMDLLTDPVGRYTANVPLPPEAAADWPVSAELTLRAARLLAEGGYMGPLGIDCMRYQTPAGAICERPLQDINARWTMGRVAWEIEQRK